MSADSTINININILYLSQFLYSRISPNATYKKLMEKRPEEEVPKILKSLGYPFTIHKTSLSNVGSPHTWPILLGALHWLMELVKVCD
jgi:kinetochore protein NDC80